MEVFFDGGKVITAYIGLQTMKTHLPLNAGGQNSAPTHFELLLTSIGTQAGIYLKSFCDQRFIPAEKMKIIQTGENDKVTGLRTNIKTDIQLPVDFPEKYNAALLTQQNFVR
jgi:putative redox protein